MSKSFTCSVHRVQGAIASMVEGLHNQQEGCDAYCFSVLQSGWL